jgi:hypothetical protein
VETKSLLNRKAGTRIENREQRSDHLVVDLLKDDLFGARE